MKLIKVDSCTNCPLCSYSPTDYYRNAYFRCTKSGFDVTGNYYSGTIYERCQLENEPNSSNTVLCKPEASASAEGAAVGKERGQGNKSDGFCYNWIGLNDVRCKEQCERCKPNGDLRGGSADGLPY